MLSGMRKACCVLALKIIPANPSLIDNNTQDIVEKPSVRPSVCRSGCPDWTHSFERVVNLISLWLMSFDSSLRGLINVSTSRSAGIDSDSPPELRRRRARLTAR